MADLTLDHLLECDQRVLEHVPVLLLSRRLRPRYAGEVGLVGGGGAAVQVILHVVLVGLHCHGDLVGEGAVSRGKVRRESNGLEEIAEESAFSFNRITEFTCPQSNRSGSRSGWFTEE